MKHPILFSIAVLVAALCGAFSYLVLFGAQGGDAELSRDLRAVMWVCAAISVALAFA